ncbi:MAG: CusA/CzcA family heavy metal efflux RND transporter [Spirochaetia bacterium]|nr:CusA/CzcA family heavy metal efflux RND transporter [Spirochaetia bacterium]
MRKIIDWSFSNKTLVLLGAVIIFFAGLWSAGKIEKDAIPDLSDTQVIIKADYPGQPPQVIEEQVTYPLTTRMLSAPFAKNVRAYSFFGYSLIYVLYEDGTDLYWARSRVLEYLNGIQDKLPPQVSLELGPDATSIGWIYQYVIKDKTGRKTLADLRDIQDFFLRYELTAIEGVSEIAAIGGFQRQFQVEVNPELLYQYGVRLTDIEKALKKANMETGARLFQQAETEYMVLARGYLRSIEEIKSIPIRIREGGAVLRMENIAHVKEGPDIRRGIADLDGEGEVVGGIVIMRPGEDVNKTINLVKKRLQDIKSSLPEGVEIITVYDRSKLINKAVSNLTFKLIEELLVVAIVTAFFLMHFRSAAVALIVLPLGVLLSLLFMNILGVTANIMSLGGIAIAVGVMVDASVVLVENTHKHLEKLQISNQGDDLYWQAARESAYETAPALFWSMMIIIVSFLPVFALPEQTGRLFTPLALTKTLAMASSSFLSILLLPVLAGYFVRGKIPSEEKHIVSSFLIRLYMPSLRWALEHKKTVFGVSAAALLLSFLPITGLKIPFAKEMLIEPIGGELMPPLEEEDLLWMPSTNIPGISISKAREILLKTDKLIKEVPEVKRVFGKIGRADTATDPAPLTMIETTILLKEKSAWRSGMTSEKIFDEIDRKARLPGLTAASYGMPIRTRIDMLATGIKTPLGVKILGDNLQKLEDLGKLLENEIGKINGIRAVYAERTMGGNYIIYDIDRYKAGIYGLEVADIQNVLATALGGRKVTDIIYGPYRWSANIRYMRDYRESIESLKNIYIPLPGAGGGKIPISQVADIRIEKGPAAIKTENARKTLWLYIVPDTGDMESLAAALKEKLQEIKNIETSIWPKSYTYIISGQFEQMKLASDRMKILIPVVLLIVFIILFLHFKNSSRPLWVMFTALFFAPLGGLWFMFLAGYNRSTASDVGFIALMGLAAETGVLMLIYLDSALANIKKKNFNAKALRGAVLEGAVLRVRPKIMTVCTTILGLLPIFWGDEPGNSAMRRIAAPMVGGLITSTIVTLILLPVIFEWYYKRSEKSGWFGRA